MDYLKETCTIQYEPIEKRHLTGITNLCKNEGWKSYMEDHETTWRVLTAPGVCAIVAIIYKEVVGFVQMQSD